MSKTLPKHQEEQSNAKHVTPESEVAQSIDMDVPDSIQMKQLGYWVTSIGTIKATMAAVGGNPVLPLADKTYVRAGIGLTIEEVAEKSTYPIAAPQGSLQNTLRAVHYSKLMEVHSIARSLRSLFPTEVFACHPLPLGVCWIIFGRFPILAGARDVAML